jgi:two-component system phosphate regulon sensor histidine kinase PhoR
MMRHKRLIWQIFPPFLVIILIALVAVTWVFSKSLTDFHIEETRRGLEAQAHMVADQVTGYLIAKDLTTLDILSKRLGEQSGTRLTVILPDGRVVADSEENPQQMNNHADRPEVIMAMRKEVGVKTRFSHTLQQEMMYVALPVLANGDIIGCVRTALPIASLADTLRGVLYPVIYSGLAIALVAALVSLWLSRRISRPLEEMKQGAQRFASGDLEGRLPGYPGEEMGGLADAMNQMAAQLDDRIRTVVRQRNEQEAVLASMVEGVLAIDKNEKILRINQAAADLLDIDPAAAVGRRIQEILRKPDIQNFITKALQSRSRIECNLTLFIHGNEHCLQGHGTPLKDAQGREIGALIVLHDITRLQRLENIRRDFVANVSHELKTPITAIKGSVETLLDGAVEDSDSTQRFLGIIARQSDRLNAIIEDLLALSRIEQGEEHAGIELTQTDLRGLLQSAVQSCQVKAQEKQIHLEMECPEALIANLNAPLLEQALVNLLDNAIKYSNEHSRVLINAKGNGSGPVTIEVRDWGCGIAREHLSRLFERFYRVDKARSRKLGGTGLGLAIVKHIIQAHNGRIEVDSTSGKGSTFTIHIPAS